MLPKPEYLPAGTDGKSKKMQSENLLTTQQYRDNWDRIFKGKPKRKGSTI